MIARTFIAPASKLVVALSLVATCATQSWAQEADAGDTQSAPAVASSSTDGESMTGAWARPAPAIVVWMGSSTQWMSEAESDRSVEERTMSAFALGAGVDMSSWLRVGVQYTGGESSGFGYPVDVDLRYLGADAVVRFAPFTLPWVTPYVKLTAGASHGYLQLQAPTGYEAEGGAWAARFTATVGVSAQYSFRSASLGVYLDGGYGIQTDWNFDSLDTENDQVDAGTLSVRGGNLGGGVFVRVPF